MYSKLLFFFLFFILNCSFSLANIEPYCNNIIPQNSLHKIDETPPKIIEIKLQENRKWQKNIYEMIKSISIDSWVNIPKKYKKKFDATILVKFNNEIKCSFKARIRQHGDISDHIEVVRGHINQSLDVDLKTGHINGITDFKLFIPKTRKNPEDEIILTELLRELGFLAPRTSFLKVKRDNQIYKMLFQEKNEKEFLEYHKRREGPIFAGDQKYLYDDSNGLGMYGVELQLPRQTNAKWATKSLQHQNISLHALTKLSRFYLLNKYKYNGANHSLPGIHLSLDNNLLAPNNPNQILKLDIWNVIIFAANGYHGLGPHNRKFYWNAINNYFEPVYYDGDLNIDDDYQETTGLEISNLPQDNFLNGIKAAKIKIKQINIENFFKKIKFRRSSLSKYQVKKKLDQIYENLNLLESLINAEKEKKETKNKNITLNNEEMLINYVNSTLKLGVDTFMVFRDPKSKSFTACKNTTQNCYQINLTTNEVKDLLRGRLIINEHMYQYIGEYSGIKDNIALSEGEINKVQLPKYRKVKFKGFGLNTNFYYDKNIKFKFDKENSTFNIYQKYSGARAYFLGGNLKNISINFSGLPKTINSTLNNYPFDRNGLTGCLSFIGLDFQNVSISSTNSNCEDSVNLINTTGYIKRFDSKNSAKDGLDIDYSNIKIDKVFINKTNNDCLDLSGGKYEFVELYLSECGDKALSVGEKSFVKLDDLQVFKSKIGLSSKDSSITFMNNVKIRKTELCFEAKRKKQEFSGGIINLNHYNCSDSPTNIDPGSFINYY